MIQSVDRALQILTALQGARRMSLGEIAARLELPPSTVHGIVRTLLAHGMVLQERDSGRYRLGPATLRLGNVYLDTLDLRSRVASWADDLAARTGFAVRTGVLLLTDVTGVLDKNKKLLSRLSVGEVRALIADGTISGGMIPKVETCLTAVEAGVGASVILDGRVPHAVLLELFTEGGAGTLIGD